MDDYAGDTWRYLNLAVFAGAAPRYLSPAAVEAPQMHVSSFASTLSQEDCYLRARDASSEMSSDQGGGLGEREGWYVYIGPVNVKITCNVRGNVIVSVAKPNYSVGDLNAYADRVATLMGLTT